MWAIITLVVIWCIGLGISLAKHGEEREDKHNFWYTLIGVLFEIWLLYKAGLFDKYM